MDSVIVKLNEGVSGAGNAVVAGRAAGAGLAGRARPRSRERLLGMELESRDDSAATSTSPKFEEGAGIVEERITGTELRSPSVQLRVLPGWRGRAAVDPRPAARRRERAELPGLRVPGGAGVRRG